MYHSFRPGMPWLDTEGKPIQAHGYSVFYRDGIYYWYGENKEHTHGGLFNKVWHWGVRCYSSTDLYNWQDRGLIIEPQPEDLQSPLHPTYCMDRPHILYCEKTGKYVAWLKIMCGRTSQFISVMQADDFLGPYEFVRKIYKPLDMDTGDFTLVKDEHTGKAYFIFDRPHFEIVTATLTEDYTAVTGEFTAHYQGLQPPYAREAPAYFTKNGRHYLMTSGTTGYDPNPTRICVFDDFHGSYEDMGEVCAGDVDATSFYSQFTCVLPVGNLYIAMADRWLPERRHRHRAKRNAQKIRKTYGSVTPYLPTEAELAPRSANELPGKWLRHGENTSISRYVWLPIQFENGKPVIRWYDEWKIEDFIKGRNAE